MAPTGSKPVMVDEQLLSAGQEKADEFLRVIMPMVSSYSEAYSKTVGIWTEWLRQMSDYWTSVWVEHIMGPSSSTTKTAHS